MKEIKLKEIFTEDEFLEFQKSATDPSDSPYFPRINTAVDKDKLKIILFKTIKSKLSQFNETYLISALNWLEKEAALTSSFIDKIKQGDELIKLKQENENMKTLLNFIDESATLKLNANGRKQMNILGASSEEVSLCKLKQINKEIQIKRSQEIVSRCPENFITFSEECISTIETQEFDIFKLEEEIGPENTLSVVSCYIFTSHGLYSVVKYNKFEKFVQAITQGYLRENPYHNDLHAADVTQTCMIYLKITNFKEFLKWNDIDFCATFLSCIVHDYRHPGYNNNLWINLNNKVAIRYNDINVLESYHISQTFKLIRSNEDYNIFSELSNSDYRKIRKQMIGFVLATDMVFHNSQFEYLKNKISTYGISKGENREKIFTELEKPEAEWPVVQQKMLEIIIHACDISNPTKPFDIYSYWADKVVNEFWKQGDYEKSLGLAVSMNCDRLTTTKAQCQVGFMMFLVGPFFTSFVEIFNELSFLTENVKANLEIFKKLREEETTKKEGK